MTREVRARRSVGSIVVALVVVGVAIVPAGASGSGRVVAQGDDDVLQIAAEEEPLCMDWIASCAASAWGNWTAGNNTLPQAVVVDARGNYQPGSVLAGAPVLDVGPPQRVTYPIHPDAVWSDGTPITSKDFEYTWRQIADGTDIYDKTGYESIESVDTTDPKTAVVTFSEPFAAWRDLFGGFYFVLPAHLLEGKRRSKVMKDGYGFSGGPWRLQGGKAGWDKGETITLVPNERYWGRQPSIQEVVFQLVPESPAELQAVKTGQVLAAYPLPIDGVLDQVEESPELTYTVSFGNSFEALWVNAARPPLDRQAVRQALAYATDRQAIVDQIVEPAIREGRVLQSFVVPTFQQFFSPAFEGYAPDQARVEQLMGDDGWTREDGIWTKGDQPAGFEVATTAGNESRALTLQLWQSQLREAGFDVTIKSVSADLLFGNRLPKGKYDAALYASVGTPDPGQCLIFCSDNIPSKANDQSGQNWTRTDSPEIDASWEAVDTDLDEAARVNDARAGQAALADYVASIPLFQTPTVFIWNRERISGPLIDNTVMGPFFNMNEWELTG